MLLRTRSLKWLLPLSLLAGWAALRPPASDPSHEMRQQLLDLMASRRALMERGSETLRHQFTPGFKAPHPLISAAPPLFTQGEIFKTQTPTNLAVNGQGWLAVQQRGKRAYTRDGRFTWQEGVLRNSHGWELLGYPAGKSELEPIRLSLEPRTYLYEGRYNGYHFDEQGLLVGESSVMDPVTGQSCVQQSQALFQIALFRLEGDVQPLTDTLWQAEQAVAGKPGEGTLGGLCPGSLELSNVDFVFQATAFSRVRQSLSPFSSGLEACESGDLRLDLCERIRKDATFRRDCLDQHRYALIPGAREVVVEPLHASSVPLYVDTASPTDLAVQGDGYLLLGDGRLIRGGSFRIDERGRWLDSQSGAPLMGGRPDSSRELVMGAGASQIEVSGEGLVHWWGGPPQGQAIALVACDRVIPDGPYVRPAAGATLQVAGPEVRLLQGELRFPGQDPYALRLTGWALMDYAGLPRIPLESPLVLPPWQANQAPAPPPPATSTLAPMLALPTNPVNKKFKI